MAIVPVIFSVLLCLAGTVLAGEADASETTHVIVLTTSDELRVRTFAELTDVGYTPLRVDDAGTVVTPEKCLEIMAVHQSGALLQIAAGEGVSIWLYSPQKNQALLQERLIVGIDGRTDASVILRAVEMLRALTLTNDVPSAAPAPEPVAPEDYRPHRLSFAGGPAVSRAISDLPPTLQAWLLFQARVVGRFYVGVSGLVPTMPMSYKNEYGSVRARNGMIALFLRVDLLKPVHRVCPFVEIGSGVQILSATGQGSGDYLDNRDTIASALIYGRFGVDFSLNSRVALFVAARVGAALPEPSVQAGENIPFGNPVIGGSLGAVVGIF